MILKLDQNWIGPITVQGPFFVQPRIGDARVWWGIHDGTETLVQITRNGVTTTHNLNVRDEVLEGLLIRQGEAKHFSNIPGQCIYLRAEDNSAAVILDQWWTE